MVKMIAKFCVFFVLALSESSCTKQNSSATPTPTKADPADQFAGQTEMNGIRYSDYNGFFDWKLVTVRYRQDSNEQRFTYANTLAWEALNKKAKDYPDGAVFAKAGFESENDPAFTSSLVPSGARRVQLMVRNKSKYKATDGWGYALFKFDGTTMSGDPVSKAQACAACHRMVPERGFVFSQPFDRRFISEMRHLPKAPIIDLSPKKVVLKFEDKATATISRSHILRRLLPARFKTLRTVKSEDLTKKHQFVGGFNEIIPSLIREMLRSDMPAAMIEDGLDRFSLVYLSKRKKTRCGESEKLAFIAMAAPPVYLPKVENGNSANLEIRWICLNPSRYL